MNEFELIARYFVDTGDSRDEVILGIGDDAAILQTDRRPVAICADTLVSGVHFLADDDPYDLGYKALAVNLSDLAAMGAEPLWATLCLTIPETNEYWLSNFANGFGDIARRYRVALIGGDTTRGPLTISVQAGGAITGKSALRRDGARVGDRVFVTGPVGDSALGLRIANGEQVLDEQFDGYLLSHLRRPEPAVEAGLILSGFASAAIDVSDGLLADLGHILRQSGNLGADIRLGDIPFSTAARKFLGYTNDYATLLNGGEDYVLCFCAPLTVLPGMKIKLADKSLKVFDIGCVTSGDGIRVLDSNGEPVSIEASGYAHF